MNVHIYITFIYDGYNQVESSSEEQINFIVSYAMIIIVKGCQPFLPKDKLVLGDVTEQALPTSLLCKRHIKLLSCLIEEIAFVC